MKKRLIKRLKNEGIIPKDVSFSDFREIIPLIDWNDEKVKTFFENLGFGIVTKAPEPEAELLREVPKEELRQLRVFPFKKDATSVKVLTDNPFNEEAFEILEWKFGLPVEVFVCPYEVMNELLSEEFEEEKESSETPSFEEAPVVRLVNELFALAVKARASDIHFEPFKTHARVRMRIDGMLHTVRKLPKSVYPAVVTRIKILSGLDIAEKRLPQDGRTKVNIGGKDFDVRVSVLPTVNGERLVLRMLWKGNLLYSLTQLGMSDRELKLFKKLILQPHGIILVTGPTGSGKTTTLYAALSELNTEEVNIITVEDPVEYQLNGIAQVQVKPQIGLDFANTLRSILRQDPNIIMIGEIRDPETARIATQAALTGHLVFSTLHTNDAPSSITRLLDIGVEPFLVASSVIGVVAQRLVRKVCPYCKQPYSPSEEELKLLGLKDFKGPFYRGVGCERCMGTGYLGRTGIYEIMPINTSIRRLIASGADTEDIRKEALKSNMKTLRQDAAQKVAQGITTFSEALRVTKDEV